MLHEQRFFFLASKVIAFALSCVYGRSPFTGYLTNVIHPTMVTLLRGCFGWSRFLLSCIVSCSTQKVFLISFPSFPPPSCSTQASLGCPSYIFCARLLWSRFFILYVVQTSGKVKHNLENGVKEKRDRLSRG